MWKIVARVPAPDGLILGYTIVDENGNRFNVDGPYLTHLYNITGPTFGIEGVTKEQIYTEVGRAFNLVDVLDDGYSIVNAKTKTKKTVSKDKLIDDIQQGNVIVLNAFLRESKKGVVTLVRKNT